MTTRKTYRATVKRDGPWWYIFVEDVGHSTQARRLDRVEHMVRDLVAIAEGIDESTFDVAITVQLGDAQSALDEALMARERAEQTQQVSHEATRAAAIALRDSGLPLRDIGGLLGLTHQRISQLVTGR